MFWVVRWTDSHSGADQAIVVEAQGLVSAHCMALRRGIEPVFIGPATDNDVQLAEEKHLLWKYTAAVERFRAFGRPLPGRHVACLMLCGIWTIIVLMIRVGHLRAWPWV